LLYGYYLEHTWDVEVDVPGGEAPVACQWAIKIKEVHAWLAERLKATAEY
jgi:hypothetical protein